MKHKEALVICDGIIFGKFFINIEKIIIEMLFHKNMVNDFEKAKSNLEKLIEWTKQNDYNLKRNEATTRLHLIDNLIFNCLGWLREDGVTEENYDNKFVDYVLGVPYRKCVIEAKREGIYFELPAGFEGRVCKLKTLAGLNNQIEAAIKQALGYCQDRGIPIGTVCNGHQLIAFLGSRQDGVPPFEGNAVVFESLDSMMIDFQVLWNSISRPAAFNLTIHKILKIQNILPPEKLSQRLGNEFPGYKTRNIMQAELQILCGLLIEDITKDPLLEEQFQRECYCPSGALSQYALISRKILEARYSTLFQKEIGASVVAVRNTQGLTKELANDITAASLGRRPIILLGDVGAGKSMFIRHFIALEAKDVLERALVLYIDFGKEPAIPTELGNYIVDSCKRKLFKEYGIDIEERNFVRGVYNFELQQFNRGIYADYKKSNPEIYKEKEIIFLEEKIKNRPEHLRSCLDHISKGQKRQIVIFLDNIDQRPIDFQDEVFLIGHGMAESWPGTVFISLRPDTFYLSKKKGSLSGYQPRVFTISPPRVDLVITKRLKFALNELADTGQLQSFPEGISLHSDILTQYIGVILESFTYRKELIEFMDNLSGGNIRQAIDFLTAFCGSGHVNTQKILDLIRESGRYLIPLHEFMRAVIYGDHEYYNSLTSPIANLFDISTTDGREHFLLPIILMHVERMGSLSGKEGFVPVSVIYDFCQRLGFQPSQIQFSFERATEKKLLETNPKFTSPIDVKAYRITTVGAYMTKRMISAFQYIDAVVVDTPIIDSQFNPKIGDAKTIEERLVRCEYFCDYLDKQWDLLKNIDLPFDWIHLSKIVRYTIASIKTKI